MCHVLYTDVCEEPAPSSPPCPVQAEEEAEYEEPPPQEALYEEPPLVGSAAGTVRATGLGFYGTLGLRGSWGFDTAAAQC